MSASGLKSLPAIGFLTVVERPEIGLLGGYLVLNASGRPLEFHCTAPVKANRAQQILYGPTLEPFLYGEQIGQTLLGKAKVEPLLVCTDVTPALAVRDFVSIPVAFVRPSAGVTASEREGAIRLDAAHIIVPAPKTAKLIEFALAGQHLAVPAAHRDDERRITEAWQPFAEEFDLGEPFARIREALDEAQRGGK